MKQDPNILNQLQARREQCLENLLSGKLVLDPAEQDAACRLDEEFEDTKRRDLVRYLAPAQPINLGELVHIINHDHLDEEKHQSTEDLNGKTEEHEN